MSLDYPNREDWLKVRSTPRNIGTETLVWISDYGNTRSIGISKIKIAKWRLKEEIKRTRRAEKNKKAA